MNKAMLISKSVVFVDENSIPKNATTMIPLYPNKKFKDIANVLFLKKIIDEDLKETSNPYNIPVYSFQTKDFTLTYDEMPPKISIINYINNEKNTKLYDIAKKIVTDGDLKSTITNIGINYELFIPNDDTKNRIDLKTLLDYKLSAICDNVQFKCACKIDDKTTLLLSISDALKNNTPIIYITANFNIKTSSETIFSDIKDLYEILEEKINKIFELK